MAEVARSLLDEQMNNHWPEFLKFLFDMAQSPNPELKVYKVILTLSSTYS